MRPAGIEDAEGFTWCSVKEAARALHCGRVSLWRWAKAGYLETAVTQTGRRLYRKDSVQHLRNPGVPFWRDIRDEMGPPPADQPKPGPAAPSMRPWRDTATAHGVDYQDEPHPPLTRDQFLKAGGADGVDTSNDDDGGDDPSSWGKPGMGRPRW